MSKLFINDSGNQVQVAELGLIAGKQQMILGDLERDFILRTAGNVQIQVGNKFYPLIYNTSNTSTDLIINSSTTILNTDSQLQSLTYPGNGNYVYIRSSKSLYISDDNTYIKITGGSSGLTSIGGTPLTNTASNTLFVSYTDTQKLTGIQKQTVVLNTGNISSFADIASYNTYDVYQNQIIYSIQDKKHYVLTDTRNPASQASWKELYLSLSTGGIINGPVAINLNGLTGAYSALHIEGQASLSDVHNLKANTSIFSIGKADYSTGVALWSNNNTYFQNLLSDSSSGFKFLTSTTSGTVVNPLTIYANGIGILSEPDNSVQLTVNGKSKFTDYVYANKGIGSIDYASGSSGFTLSVDPNDNKWLLEVDKLFVRDDLSQAANFNTKSIDGSYWSNPSIKITLVDVLNSIDVYTTANFSGNYKDVAGTKVIIPLSEKQEYALVDVPVDYTDPNSARNVLQMHIAFGNGDRNSSGVLSTQQSYVYDGSAYVQIPGEYSYDGTKFNVDGAGTYILNQTISIVYIETDSLALLSVDDILYYATWNPDGSEGRVVVGRVNLINDTGAIIHVYHSEQITLNQEMILIASTANSNGIHFNGIDPNGDYIEHLVNPHTCRDVFSNFYYTNDNYELLPRNTYKPSTAITTNKFGALNNIVDTQLNINGTSQIGLYSSNAYLKGNFVLNSAVMIGSTTSAPSSAPLYFANATGGIVMPQFSQTNRLALNLTPTGFTSSNLYGMQVYQTDNTIGQYINLNGTWQRFLTTGDSIVGNQNANYGFMGPVSGSPAPPTFRLLVANDIPTTLNATTIPTIYGGPGITSALNLQGTTGNGTLTSAAINFLTGNNGATNAITILNNGHVGIANTNPTYTLDVTGILRSNGYLLNLDLGLFPVGSNQSVVQTYWAMQLAGLTNTIPESYTAANVGVGRNAYHVVIPMSQPSGAGLAILGIASQTTNYFEIASVANKTTTHGDIFSINQLGRLLLGTTTDNGADIAQFNGSIITTVLKSGSLQINGSTSGSAIIKTAAAAGTPTFTLPTTVGSSGQVLTTDGSVSGVLSWTTSFVNPMTTLGDIIYGGTSGVPTRLIGNTTTTQLFLTQTGTGSVSAAPTYFDLFGTSNSWGGHQTFNGYINMASGSPILFYNTAGTFYTQLNSSSSISNNRLVSFQDKGGTIALIGDNVSEFTNDSGYLTPSTGINVGDTRNAANFGLTASLADVGHYDNPGTGDQTYRVGAWLNLLSASGQTVTVSVSWTDNHSNSQTKTFFPQGSTSATLSTATTFYALPTMDFRVLSGTTIQVFTTVSGTGSILYEAGTTITKIVGI